MLFGYVGDALRDGGAVGTHDRADPVLRDQLLVDPNRCLSIGAVIVDHELDRTSKGTALFVDVLLAEQVALTNVPALYGVPSRDRDRGAESDRLLGHARPRCSNSEHVKKDTKTTVRLLLILWLLSAEVCSLRYSPSPRSGRRLTLAFTCGRASEREPARQVQCVVRRHPSSLWLERIGSDDLPAVTLEQLGPRALMRLLLLLNQPTRCGRGVEEQH